MELLNAIGKAVILTAISIAIINFAKPYLHFCTFNGCLQAPSRFLRKSGNEQ